MCYSSPLVLRFNFNSLCSANCVYACFRFRIKMWNRAHMHESHIHTDINGHRKTCLLRTTNIEATYADRNISVMKS